MAHPEQLEFIQLVKNQFPERFVRNRVLEIGSLDINGTIRSFFTECDYIGLDIAEGKGVDVVCEGQKYDAPDASFDVVISCEVMEHNPYWKETMDNMIRLTRPGGLVIMSCATLGRREHGTARSKPGSSPLTVKDGWNYYRNLISRDFKRAINLKALASHKFASNWDTFDLYFVGIKAPAGGDDAARLDLLFAHYRNRFWTSPKWIRRAFRKHLKYRLLGK
jgi:SAM-dependent methyltransferase